MKTRSSSSIGTDTLSHVLTPTSSRTTRRVGLSRNVKPKNQNKRTAASSKPKNNKNKFKPAYTNSRAAKLLADNGNSKLFREDLSSLTQHEKSLLVYWGLPPQIVWKYNSKGVKSLFKWQVDCLANEKVLNGRNLVYSAPTSAGKTLVAEILMIKRVLELGKKAIMILPFVSVAREKTLSLQDLFGDAGVRVEGMMGSCNPPGGFAAVDIAICTIEKANGLINRLLEEGTLSTVGTIVVDELHLIGDSDRGYLLELLLTKIKFMMGKQSESLSTSQVSEGEHSSSQNKSEKLNIQICGMSATLPNLNLLAKWLDAELVITDFRPVPLVERIKIDGAIYDQSLKLLRFAHIPSLQVDIKGDDDDIIYLSLETVLEGRSVLIFCPTKAWCEKTAVKIANAFLELGKPDSDRSPKVGANLRKQIITERVRGVLAQLEACPAGLDSTLGRAVSFGVAFHHAGLTMDERDIIESAFKTGSIRVVVATSTLSAGVNLPARRVIISTPQIYNGKQLDCLTYRQMCGRAGRNGIDSEGESILVCSSVNMEMGKSLIRSSLSVVTSSLLESKDSLPSSMKRALLEVIASGIVKSPADVRNYIQCTLLSMMSSFDTTTNCDLPSSQENRTAVVEQCLQFLEENEFIRLRKSESAAKSDEYITTQLGSACLASSLAPDAAICVFKELQKARECFVLENELHIVYQVTPISLSNKLKNVNWYQFLNVYDRLPTLQKLVGGLVGVKENFMIHAAKGLASWKDQEDAKMLSIHQRFFTALALNDLVHEVPISQVSEKYKFNKGQLQSLQQGASTFAGMLTAFCNRLGWFNMEVLLCQFAPRLQFGVPVELCDLLKLSRLNGQLSRILYDAGIKTVVDLAKTDPTQIEQILHRAGSFNSSVHGEPSTRSPIRMPGKKEKMTDEKLASLIVYEARQYFLLELGLHGQFEFGVSTVRTAQHSTPSTQSNHPPASQMPDLIPMIPSQVDSAFCDSSGNENGEDDDDNEVEKDKSNIWNKDFKAASTL